MSPVFIEKPKTDSTRNTKLTLFNGVAFLNHGIKTLYLSELVYRRIGVFQYCIRMYNKTKLHIYSNISVHKVTSTRHVTFYYILYQ